MPQVILACNPATVNDEACGCCGGPVNAPVGARLILAETAAPVCTNCARPHAPSLAALVHLADAATRVGRIGRHSVFPPLTALLDLASAAEQYAAAASPDEYAKTL
jgi:hypothetical protein